MTINLRIARAMSGLVADMGRMMVTVPLRRAAKGPLRPGWSTATEIFFEVLKRESARMMAMRPSDLRAYRDLSSVLPTPRGVHFESRRLGGVPCEWAIPSTGGERGVLLYLHGGAYVFGSPRTVRVISASVAREADVRVASLDYRLAPDHGVPEALDDALAAMRALYEEFGADRVTIGGDSAGGGLSLSTLLALRDAGDPMPKGAALLSPWLDLAGRIKSHPSRHDWAGPGFGAHFSKIVCGTTDPTDPRLSPIEADFSGLPRTLVQIGTAELLYDEVSVFIARAQEAGVDLVVDAIAEGYHSIQYVDSPEAAAARSHLAAFLRGALTSR